MHIHKNLVTNDPKRWKTQGPRHKLADSLGAKALTCNILKIKIQDNQVIIKSSRSFSSLRECYTLDMPMFFDCSVITLSSEEVYSQEWWLLWWGYSPLDIRLLMKGDSYTSYRFYLLLTYFKLVIKPHRHLYVVHCTDFWVVMLIFMRTIHALIHSTNKQRKKTEHTIWKEILVNLSAPGTRFRSHTCCLLTHKLSGIKFTSCVIIVQAIISINFSLIYIQQSYCNWKYVNGPFSYSTFNINLWNVSQFIAYTII